MPKPIIAVDFDDVVSSQTDALAAFSNARYGTQLSRQDFLKPGEYWAYYEHIWDVEAAEGQRRFQEFLDEGYPLRQVVDATALATLKTLQHVYDLVIVTSRDAGFRQGTLEMIEAQATKLFSDVHFVYLWDEPNRKATKAHICKEIGAEYLIDDNLEHCNLAAEAGVRALLFGEFGWNVGGAISTGVIRVRDWTEIFDYFKDKKHAETNSN